MQLLKSCQLSIHTHVYDDYQCEISSVFVTRDHFVSYSYHWRVPDNHTWVCVLILYQLRKKGTKIQISNSLFCIKELCAMWTGAATYGTWYDI